MTLPSGRMMTVIDYNAPRDTYVCLLDIHDVDYVGMSKRELLAARLVEFKPSFILKHCKERE